MSHPVNKLDRYRIAKAKARRRLYKYGSDAMEDTEWVKQTLRMHRNTVCDCSCPACGNPRRHFGERSVQERKQGIDK